MPGAQTEAKGRGVWTPSVGRARLCLLPEPPLWPTVPGHSAPSFRDITAAWGKEGQPHFIDGKLSSDTWPEHIGNK